MNFLMVNYSTYGTLIEDIEGAAVPAASAGNILTDGETACTYADLPEIFAAWDQALRRGGVAPGDCLALEVGQSLTAALTVLHLLARGIDFAVLPPPEARSRFAHGGGGVPSFCRFRLAPPPHPEGAPTVEANEAFALPGPPGSAAPDLPAGPAVYLLASRGGESPHLARHLQAGLLRNVTACARRLGLSPADRIAVPVPIFHMYGLGAAFLAGVTAGACLDLQARANVLRFMDRERSFEPTIAYLTPAFCAALVGVRKSPRPYRFCVSAGDRLPEDLRRRHEGKLGPLLNLYGSTEMGVMAVADPELPAEGRGVRLGAPVDGVELAVRGHGEAAGTAERTGELLCRHRDGFAGWVGLDGQPRGDGSDGAGWFATRDLARLDAGGAIEILGRLDARVNRDGLLVSLDEVEAALARLEGVAQAAVVARGESPRGERLVAFCTTAEGAPSGVAIRRRSHAVLPPHAVPDEVIVMEALPRAPGGGVDRRALGQVLDEGRAASGPRRAGASGAGGTLMRKGA